MDQLAAFLAENVEKIPNKKVVVSPRFKDGKGYPIEWEIKAISCTENEDLQRQAMVSRKQPNGQVTRELDSIKYLALLVAESVVFPDLLNAKLQDSYGVKTPTELIKKMLYPREFNSLAEMVTAFSQVDNLADKVEEAKN